MNENTQNNIPEVTEVQLDYEALWKEAKYSGETKESER